MTYALRITAATVFIILCTFLPCLPGRYDSLAAPVSLMAQVFGYLGLLLVPVGAIWMAAEYRSGRSPVRSPSSAEVGRSGTARR